jgi:phosphotransacetylase
MLKDGMKGSGSKSTKDSKDKSDAEKMQEALKMLNDATKKK